MVIMSYVAVPYLQHMGPNATLQHDNARLHNPRVVITFTHISNVDVLDWPACSPDLNPIEHVWDQLGRVVHQRLTPERQFFQEEWDILTQANIRTLVYNIMRASVCCMYRCAFIGPTKYWINVFMVNHLCYFLCTCGNLQFSVHHPTRLLIHVCRLILPQISSKLAWTCTSEW